MEQKIILEGIHAMLEEIRDNTEKNSELEIIKSQLTSIEKVCNEFAGQKFVTEEVMAQFLACTLQRIMEMNEKQDEKMRGHILGHHKSMKEQIYIQYNKINQILGEIETALEKERSKLNYYKRLKKYLDNIFM